MVENILFSEIKAAAAKVHLVRQLLGVKRCFGSSTSIGVVVAPNKVDSCSTVAELVSHGHVHNGLGWIDQYLSAVPTVYEQPTDSFVVVPRRYPSGPPCPWDVAEQEQELARARIKIQRLKGKTA